MNLEEIKLHFQLQEGFNIKEGIFCGQTAFLITPNDIKTSWKNTDMFNRSRIISENGDVLSQGFSKFFNYGEQPDLYPNFVGFDDIVVEEKKDGSLVIVDFVNGQLSMRTRGTFSYTQLENNKDFESLPKKARDIAEFNPDTSFLFEITTPNRQIVVSHKFVDFTLIGAVNKKTQKYWTREELDAIGLQRPEVYKFDNFEQLIEAVSKWEGKEGVVVSYNKNQNRVKIKSIWYKSLHSILSGLNSEKNIVKLLVSSQVRSIEQLSQIVDFETLSYIEGKVEKIIPIWGEFDKVLSKVDAHLFSIEGQTRKEKALWANSLEDKLKKLAFMRISGKPIDDKYLIDFFLDELRILP
jgi:hypothetical protein